MLCFYQDQSLLDWLFLTIVILIPVLNGIACFFIFRRIIIKVLVGTALVLVTFIANYCFSIFLFLFMQAFNVNGKHSFDTISQIITIFLCGCFTVWLYKIGIRNGEMRKEDWHEGDNPV